MRCIANLETPSSGELTIDSTANQIAMVFQDHALFPWMSLEKNISLILKNNPKFNSEKVQQQTLLYLKKVGLAKQADLFPHQVSGGMRQRINVARSFANEADILLMDEPFVFLDFQTRLTLQELLLSIWQEQQKTIVFVTHDIEEAVLLADRIIVLSQQPGEIREEIEVDFPRPRNILETRKQAKFIHFINDLIDLVRSDKIIENQ